MYSSAETLVEQYRICFYVILLLLSGLATSSLGQTSSPDDIYWSDKFFVSGLDNFDRGAALTVYNGNLIVGGAFEHADGIDARNVAGWNGSSWSPLGNGVDSMLSLTVFNNQLVAGLERPYPSDGGVVIWREGTGWEPLGGGFDGDVASLIVYDGQLIAAGSFSNAGGVPANNIAKWNGLKWDSLSSGVNGGSLQSDRVSDMVIYNSQLIVAGDFDDAGGLLVDNIAMWNGFSWKSLDANISGHITTLTSFDGELYIGGLIWDSTGNVSSSLVIWNGSTWLPFSCGYKVGFVNTMIVYDSSLIISGHITDSTGNTISNVLTWDGSMCVPFNQGTDGSIEEFAIYNGDLIAMGEFNTAAGIVANGIARWDGASWNSMTTRQGQGLGYEATGEGVRDIAIHDRELIASGRFRVAGDVVSNQIASWDGNAWSPIGIGNDTTIYALYSSTSGLVVAGVINPYPFRPFVTLYDGTNLTPLLDASQFSIDSSMGHPISSSIRDLTKFHGELIVAGRFKGIDGVTMNNIARWNGSNWLPMGSGTDGTVFDMIVFDSLLVVTGQISVAGGILANGIAAWDGANWTSIGVGKGIVGHLDNLAIYDGELIVEGADSINGIQVNQITKWNGVKWDSLGSGITDTSGYISGMISHGNDLIVVGDFDEVGGVSLTNIAKWDGTSWSALGSGIPGDEDVSCLAVFHDNLMVGGGFSTAGRKASAGIAQWSKPSAGSCCVGLTGNIDGDVGNIVDITDLTVLIDHLFISLDPLVCIASANIDGDSSGVVDITDLTVLIDHLFISLVPTAPCQ